MDYFNDVLTTFLGLERGTVAAYAGSESSRISSKTILICIPMMNEEDLTGLDLTVYNSWSEFSFLGETIPLINNV